MNAGGARIRRNQKKDQPPIESDSTPSQIHSTHEATHSRPNSAHTGRAVLRSSMPNGASIVEHKTVSELTNESAVVDEHDGSLRGDRGSIALLMCLYILQGIPLGLAASIPYLLQSRKVFIHSLYMYVSTYIFIYLFFSAL